MEPLLNGIDPLSGAAVGAAVGAVVVAVVVAVVAGGAGGAGGASGDVTFFGEGEDEEEGDSPTTS